MISILLLIIIIMIMITIILMIIIMMMISTTRWPGATACGQSAQNKNLELQGVDSVRLLDYTIL